MLLITDLYSGGKQNFSIDYPTVSSSEGKQRDGNIDNSLVIDTSAEEDLKRLKKSMWLSSDHICPPVWCVSTDVKVSDSILSPPPKSKQMGPFRVSELFFELERGAITLDTLVAPITTEESEVSSEAASNTHSFVQIVDTGRWRPMKDYFQLRLQLLYSGRAVYSPADVALKSLNLLQSLAEVHKCANSKGKLKLYHIWSVFQLL